MKKWLISIIARYWSILTVMLILQTGYAILVSLQPLYFQKVVSLAIRETGPALLTEGIPVVALLAAIYLAGTLFRGLDGYFGCLFSSNLLRQLQADFFEKTGQLPLHFLQHQSISKRQKCFMEMLLKY